MSEVIRGTTPKHIFEFPEDFDMNVISEVLITYKQNKRILLEKTLKNLETDPTLGRVLYFGLSQEDTLKFDAHGTITVQVRVLTRSGEALASDEYSLSIKDVLDDDVLTENYIPKDNPKTDHCK